VNVCCDTLLYIFKVLLSCTLFKILTLGIHNLDTIHFVQDVFTALQTKAFRSVNATLTGGALSAHMPTPQESPPPTVVSASPPSTVMHGDRSDGGRSQKRPYFDRDEPEEEERLKPHHGRERGSKMARRGGAHGPGRWARGGTGGGVEGGNSGGGRGNSLFPGAQHNLANVVPPVVPMPQMFGLPPATRPGLFPPWIPPSNPHDPIPAFLAAQAAAAWGFPGLPGTKIDGEKAIIKKVGERCMDYDEKGFCMKGDTCPYEHGVDHIVVPGQEAKAEGQSFDLYSPLPSAPLIIRYSEYDPNDSMLISSSRIVAEKKSTPAPSHRGRGGRGGQRGGKSGRAGFSSTGPNFDRSNTRLVVENIPEDKLSESAIKEFFGSFGNVVSVDIHQHKNLAILNFSQWEVAKAAYDSPAPIFDNRFVKVFWCKPSLADGGTELLPTTGARNFSHSKSELEEVKIDIEEVKRKQEELQRAHEEKMAKKKANEEAAMELQKRKEELIKLQKEEQKKLMEKLAKKRAATTAASASAAKTTTDFNALPSSPSSSDHTNRVQSANGDAKPKSEMTKADATTAALKAQLEALQAEAEALGIDQNASAEEAFDLEGFRGRGRGRFPTRGGYFSRGRGYSSYRGGSRGTIYAPRGRGAGGGLPTMKLDNRTKRVAVTAQGFKGEKEEAFRHYLIVGFFCSYRRGVFFY
jgi:RNA-binding protein 26